MPNTKKFYSYTTTAKTVYGIIERLVDSYRLNDADGTFASNPADPYISFTEHTVIKGEYVLSENRTVWNDGSYLCVMYEQVGGSPLPASDMVIAYQYMQILGDSEVIMANVKSDTAAILLDTGTDGVVVASGSKSNYTLSSAGIDAILDEIVEGTLTMRQILRLALSVLAGKSSGGGTGMLTFLDNAGAKARITARVDKNGDRITMTLDAT